MTPERQRGAGQTASGARILVVDDEAGVRRMACEVLNRAGFVTLSAEHGEAALAMMRDDAAAIDLVLLDMTMPRMTGAETLQMLRARHPNLRIVLTSGYGEVESREQVGTGARIGFIQKPFRPAALVQTMLDALGEHPDPAS